MLITAHAYFIRSRKRERHHGLCTILIIHDPTPILLSQHTQPTESVLCQEW